MQDSTLPDCENLGRLFLFLIVAIPLLNLAATAGRVRATRVSSVSWPSDNQSVSQPPRGNSKKLCTALSE